MNFIPKTIANIAAIPTTIKTTGNIVKINSIFFQMLN
jgi:hypothetical protein